MSILETLESLTDRGVDVRILHGRAPSRPFRQELGSRARLGKALKMRECPRVHLKTLIVDGSLLYLGSANFTGAGLGARAPGKRNFELGILTEDCAMLDSVQAHFDRIWSGRECRTCQLRRLCPKPIDTLGTKNAVTGPPRGGTPGIAKSQARSRGKYSRAPSR
jgi:phosphatidylserine/phosphatidylglycerophosphate/cardiolipin synthase-like enzyme